MSHAGTTIRGQNCERDDVGTRGNDRPAAQAPARPAQRRARARAGDPARHGGDRARRGADRLHAVAAASAGRPRCAVACPSPSAAWCSTCRRPPSASRCSADPAPRARIDLSFLWPSLDPPDATVKPKPTDAPDVTDRLFMTIAASDSTLPPMERLKEIYPRYIDDGPIVGAERAQRAELPRRLALPGRGPDLRSGGGGAISAPLHPPGRIDTRPCACTSGGSTAPTSWCASRAHGSAIGGRSPAASTG